MKQIIYFFCYIFFLLVIILFTSCQSVPVKNNVIHSDTLLIQRFDTLTSKEILIPKFLNTNINITSKDFLLVPNFIIDTIIPVKNKQGKITGKSNVKIIANEDGTLNFENEIINSDSIPQITNFVSIEIPLEKEKGFFEKLKDKALGFIDFVFIMIGLLVVAGTIGITIFIYKWYRNRK